MKVEEKQFLLEYMESIDIISREEYHLGCLVREAFQKQISLSMGYDYTKIFTEGGKQDNDFTKAFDSQKDYKRFCEMMIYNKDLFEHSILIDQTKEQFYKRIGANFKEFKMILEKIALALSALSRVYYGEQREIIRILREKITKNGIRKTSRDLKISRNTIRRIIFHDMNFTNKSLQRLLIYFKIK